jgi:hypothetical protein
MHKLADLIEANGAEITKAEVIAMGQPTAIMGNFVVPVGNPDVRTAYETYTDFVHMI